MNRLKRYGVFRLGQIWSVIGDDGLKLGFPSRGQALTAVQSMAALERAGGWGVEVVVQDVTGRLHALGRPTF